MGRYAIGLPPAVRFPVIGRWEVYKGVQMCSGALVRRGALGGGELPPSVTEDTHQGDGSGHGRGRAWMGVCGRDGGGGGGRGCGPSPAIRWRPWEAGRPLPAAPPLPALRPPQQEIPGY